MEIERLKGDQQKLHGVIRSLEKDIVGLKKEIQERDETIQDKVDVCAGVVGVYLYCSGPKDVQCRM